MADHQHPTSMGPATARFILFGAGGVGAAILWVTAILSLGYGRRTEWGRSGALLIVATGVVVIGVWRRRSQQRDAGTSQPPIDPPQPTVLAGVQTPMRMEVLVALRVLERDLRWERVYWMVLGIPIAGIIAAGALTLL